MMAEETNKAGVVFNIESYRKLWSIMDREDRAKLLLHCQLPYVQRKAITLLDNGGYSSKEAIRILGLTDHRQFERIRAKALQRLFSILNSPKHNQYYSNILLGKN